MFKKISLFTLLVSALLLTGCAADKSTDKSGDAMEKAEIPDVVKIGYIGPLTGNAASYGQDIKLGIELYFSENPTIDGKTVEVIYEDGKCNGQDAANAAQKLINVDKVKFILGGQCSGETLAVAPIAEQNKVILLSSLSSSPEVTTAGDYVFRNYPSDDKVALTNVNAVLKNHEKVALFTEQTDYAQGYRQAVKKHMTNAGVELVMDEAFAVDNSDFRTLLTKATDNDVTAIMVVPQGPVTGAFLAKQTKELGIDVELYFSETVAGPDFFETAKDAAEGVYSTSVAEDAGREGYAEFVEKVKDDVQFGALFTGFGYDAAQLIAETIAEFGYSAENAKNHFNTMDTFKGVASDIAFDENGDNDIPAGVSKVIDGELVLVTE